MGGLYITLSDEYDIEKIRNQWVVVKLKKHSRYKRALKIIALHENFTRKRLIEGEQNEEYGYSIRIRRPFDHPALALIHSNVASRYVFMFRKVEVNRSIFEAYLEQKAWENKAPEIAVKDNWIYRRFLK